MDSVPLKRCNRCGDELPHTPEFFPRTSKGGKSYIKGHCKPCARAENRRLYQASAEQRRRSSREYYESGKGKEAARRYAERNREKINASAREYKERNREIVLQRQRAAYWSNPERHRAMVNTWRSANLEKARAQERTKYYANRDARLESTRRWRDKNRERINEYARLYAAANTDKIRANINNRRHRLIGEISNLDIREAFSRQRGCCFYCGRKVGSSVRDVKWHVDHFIPISRGGTNTPENIVIACQPCNNRKYNKLPHEFMPEKFPSP